MSYHRYNEIPTIYLFIYVQVLFNESGSISMLNADMHTRPGIAHRNAVKSSKKVVCSSFCAMYMQMQIRHTMHLLLVAGRQLWSGRYRKIRRARLCITGAIWSRVMDMVANGTP